MPRLFVALEIAHQASASMALLRGGLSGAKWIDPENYHLTLRFLGDLEGPMADEIADALYTINQPRFALSFIGLGAFGGKKPRSLFAVPQHNQTLYDLQSDIERRCKRLGLGADKRKFTPHVTLARLRGTPPAAVANYIGLRGGFSTPAHMTTRFVLLSSRDSVGGGPYIREEVYGLRGPSPVSSLATSASEAERMSW